MIKKPKKIKMFTLSAEEDGNKINLKFTEGGFSKIEILGILEIQKEKILAELMFRSTALKTKP